MTTPTKPLRGKHQKHCRATLGFVCSCLPSPYIDFMTTHPKPSTLKPQLPSGIRVWETQYAWTANLSGFNEKPTPDQIQCAWCKKYQTEILNEHVAKHDKKKPLKSRLTKQQQGKSVSKENLTTERG